ncbi:MAG: DUF92 domain-containing protein [Nitrososphaerota archaeon]|nr:DUF92 domain-containing protein [Nitrososphaerota archaeon]
MGNHTPGWYHGSVESNTTIPGDVQTLGAVLLIALLAVLAVKLKAIDVLGALVGSLIIFVAFLAGGFSWLLVFIAFFVISSLLTRFRYEYKISVGAAP